MVSDVHGSGGHVSSSKNTCADIIIQNKSYKTKIITEQNIVATTSRDVVTRWNIPPFGSRALPTPAETQNQFNPKTVFIKLPPGETYRGSICFNRQLPIAKLELQGL